MPQNRTDNAIISIRLGVPTFQPREPRVLACLKSKPVSATELLKLRNNTVRDNWYTFGIKRVHASFEDIELCIQRMGDEVRVHNYLVRRAEGRVSGEEELARHSRYMDGSSGCIVVAVMTTMLSL